MAVIDLACVQTLFELKSEDSDLPETRELKRFYTESTRDLGQSAPLSNAFGMYASGRRAVRYLTSNAEELERTFWSTAKSIGDELRVTRSRKPLADFLPISHFLFRSAPKKWREKSADVAPEKFRREMLEVDYALLNTGPALKAVDGRAFEIADVRGAVPMTRNNGCLVNGVHSVGAKLTWSINWGSHVLSEEQVMVYAGMVEEVLRRLVDGRLG